MAAPAPFSPSSMPVQQDPLQQGLNTAADLARLNTAAQPKRRPFAPGAAGAARSGRGPPKPLQIASSDSEGEDKNVGEKVKAMKRKSATRTPADHQKRVRNTRSRTPEKNFQRSENTAAQRKSRSPLGRLNYYQRKNRKPETAATHQGLARVEALRDSMRELTIAGEQQKQHEKDKDKDDQQRLKEEKRAEHDKRVKEEREKRLRGEWEAREKKKKLKKEQEEQERLEKEQRERRENNKSRMRDQQSSFKSRARERVSRPRDVRPGTSVARSRTPLNRINAAPPPYKKSVARNRDEPTSRNHIGGSRGRNYNSSTLVNGRGVSRYRPDNRAPAPPPPARSRSRFRGAQLCDRRELSRGYSRSRAPAPAPPPRYDDYSDRGAGDYRDRSPVGDFHRAPAAKWFDRELADKLAVMADMAVRPAMDLQFAGEIIELRATNDLSHGRIATPTVGRIGNLHCLDRDETANIQISQTNPFSGSTIFFALPQARAIPTQKIHVGLKVVFSVGRPKEDVKHAAPQACGVKEQLKKKNPNSEKDEYLADFIANFGGSYHDPPLNWLAGEDAKEEKRLVQTGLVHTAIQHPVGQLVVREMTWAECKEKYGSNACEKWRQSLSEADPPIRPLSQSQSQSQYNHNQSSATGVSSTTAPWAPSARMSRSVARDKLFSKPATKSLARGCQRTAVRAMNSRSRGSRPRAAERKISVIVRDDDDVHVPIKRGERAPSPERVLGKKRVSAGKMSSDVSLSRSRSEDADVEEKKAPPPKRGRSREPKMTTEGAKNAKNLRGHQSKEKKENKKRQPDMSGYEGPKSKKEENATGANHADGEPMDSSSEGLSNSEGSAQASGSSRVRSRSRKTSNVVDQVRPGNNPFASTSTVGDEKLIARSTKEPGSGSKGSGHQSASPRIDVRSSPGSTKKRPRKESVDGSSMDDSGNSDGEHRGEPQDGSCDEQEQPARKKARRVYNMCATVG